MHRSLRLTAILSLFVASPAFAQEEKGGLLSIDTGLMVWTVLIFLIALFVLYKAAYPHILGAVEAREQRIRELLAAAKENREEANALLGEQRKQMDEVRLRAQEALAEGRAAGERLREEILAQARRDQTELLERTRRDVSREMERALAELRTEAVEIAIAAASKLLERNLDAEDNRRLVREYLAKVDLGDDAAATVGA
jgi:F-type H+-transporting ATPase subunit b